jgi:hypothetical protein
VRKRLADGSVRTYYYHRDTGTRLNGKPGSPEFIVSYTEAKKNVPHQHGGLCTGLIRAFLTSPEFENNLQPTTQKEYRRVLIAIEAKFGRAPIDAMADPRFAGDVLEWGISANVLEGYERIYRADRSDKVWLPKHIDAMQKVASPEFWPLFLGAISD